MFCAYFLLNSSKKGDIVYKSQSQDEEALVQAAARLRMVLVNKSANTLGINLFLCLISEVPVRCSYIH